MANPRRILITAGPTWEPIDSVRFIGNRSSGQMGVSLAEAAVEAGHDVTLLLGKGASAGASSGNRLNVERFESTADLSAAIDQYFPSHDLLVMAAAVADYRPAKVHDGKLSRANRLELSLEPTPDLVAGVAATKRADQRVVAFALEPADQLTERARAKMTRKGVDAIVANPLETMDATSVDGHLLFADGRLESPGAMSKPAFAKWLIAAICP